MVTRHGAARPSLRRRVADERKRERENSPPSRRDHRDHRADWGVSSEFGGGGTERSADTPCAPYPLSAARTREMAASMSRVRSAASRRRTRSPRARARHLGAHPSARVARDTKQGWHATCALSHDSNRQQARALLGTSRFDVRAVGSLPRARRLAPRPRLRGPARAAARRDASTYGLTAPPSARSSPALRLGGEVREPSFRAHLRPCRARRALACAAWTARRPSLRRRRAPVLRAAEGSAALCRVA